MDNRPPPAGSIPPPGANPGPGAFQSSQVAPTPPARRERSTALTLVAIYFFAGGTLGGIGLLSDALGSGNDAILLLIVLIFGGPFVVATLIAGKRLWRREESGRSLGKLLAGLGVAFNLLYLLAGSSALPLIGLTIDSLVLWFLWTTTELV
jgi:hypothetical protein